MVFFRRKFKVRARTSRGQGSETGDATPEEALKALLCDKDGYAETREDYDNNLDEAQKESFIAALGSLGPVFEAGNTGIEMSMNVMEASEIEAIYNAMNEWQEANETD